MNPLYRIENRVAYCTPADPEDPRPLYTVRPGDVAVVSLPPLQLPKAYTALYPSVTSCSDTDWGKEDTGTVRDSYGVPGAPNARVTDDTLHEESPPALEIVTVMDPDPVLGAAMVGAGEFPGAMGAGGFI